MKQAKAPTRAQKILMSKSRINPADWLVSREDKDSLEIVCRYTGRKKIIRKDLMV